MLKKRRYILAAVLVLLLTAMAVLLVNARRGADAKPGAGGASFVCGEEIHNVRNALQ